MKKLALLFVFTIMIMSCKSTSTVDNYVNYEAQRNVKGTWMVTNVEYPNSNYIQINLLDIASSNCFKNSTWNFISNNNKGSITFPNNCSQNRDITWYINNDGQMVLKILGSESSRKTDTGYVLDYIPVNSDKFILRDKVSVASSTVEFSLTFERL